MKPKPPACGNCAHVREHEQLGGKGWFCHGDTPKLTLLPGGSRVVHGKPELQGLMMQGLWAPVDLEGGLVSPS
jgi:hypothetical protein